MIGVRPKKRREANGRYSWIRSILGTRNRECKGAVLMAASSVIGVGSVVDSDVAFDS